MSRRKGGIGKPPHKCFTFRLTHTVLIMGIFLCTILLAQSILHNNPTWIRALSAFTQPPLISTEAAFTILITILGIIVVERQYSNSAVPLLQTSMVDPDKMELNTNPTQPFEHRCFLKNLGSGRAVIRKVRYRLIFSDENEEEQGDYNLTHFQLIKALLEKGLVEDTDFFMPRLAENCTFMAPDSSLSIHLSNEKFGVVTRYLDVHIVYENVLGRRYMKDFPILYHYRPSVVARAL